MTSSHGPRTQSGFTLVELMVAAVILAILFMAFLSTLTGSFLADTSSTIANSARVTAERLMEESLDLSYSQCLLLDQNAVLAADGLACKIGVVEVSTGLLLIEVNVCKPVHTYSPAQLAAMTLVNFRNLDYTSGSPVRLLCLKAER